MPQLSQEQVTNEKYAIDAPAGRAVRSNQGGGGPAKRIEAFDEATERSKRRKPSNTMSIPESEPLNPMAPRKRKRPRRLPKTKVCCCLSPYCELNHMNLIIL
jgi:hypothetical protein